jgi:hypothetical protein
MRLVATFSVLSMFVSTDGATVFNDAFGVDVSGHSAVESAFVSKGMTCHDGAVWNPSATASNFRIGDAWKVKGHTLRKSEIS